MKSKYYIILAISLLFLLKISPSYGIGDTTFVFTYDASGNRTERVIDLTKSVEITASSSSLSEEKLIEAELSSLDIKIYPNPTKGVLKVEILEIGDIKPTLVVYNLQGKQLVNRTVSNQISTINLSEQPPGMYIMKIVNGAESLDWKIIKD